jgi:hypothetical protein
MARNRISALTSDALVWLPPAHATVSVQAPLVSPALSVPERGRRGFPLSTRSPCTHGVCGSDAMRINGRNRLACKSMLKDLDLGKPIIVEPLQGLPVERPHCGHGTFLPVLSGDGPLPDQRRP